MTDQTKMASKATPSPAYVALSAPAPDPLPAPDHKIIPWHYSEDLEHYLSHEAELREHFVRDPRSEHEIIITLHYRGDDPDRLSDVEYIGDGINERMRLLLRGIPHLRAVSVPSYWKAHDSTEVHFEFEDIWLCFTTEVDWRKSIAPPGCEVLRAYKSVVYMTGVMMEALRDHWIAKGDPRAKQVQVRFDRDDPPLFVTDPVNYPLTQAQRKFIS